MAKYWSLTIRCNSSHTQDTPFLWGGLLFYRRYSQRILSLTDKAVLYSSFELEIISTCASLDCLHFSIPFQTFWKIFLQFRLKQIISMKCEIFEVITIFDKQWCIFKKWKFFAGHLLNLDFHDLLPSHLVVKNFTIIMPNALSAWNMLTVSPTEKKDPLPHQKGVSLVCTKLDLMTWCEDLNSVEYFFTVITLRSSLTLEWEYLSQYYASNKSR